MPRTRSQGTSRCFDQVAGPERVSRGSPPLKPQRLNNFDLAGRPHTPTRSGIAARTPRGCEHGGSRGRGKYVSWRQRQRPKPGAARNPPRAQRRSMCRDGLCRGHHSGGRTTSESRVLPPDSRGNQAACAAIPVSGDRPGTVRACQSLRSDGRVCRKPAARIPDPAGLSAPRRNGPRRALSRGFPRAFGRLYPANPRGPRDELSC